MNNGTTYPYELPKGWVWTRLGDVLGFVKGKKPKNLGTRNNLLTIPYIDINAFENEIFDEFTDGDKCPLCQTDDTLIVWDGARCGLVGRGVAGAIGSTLAKLPCFEVNSTYVFYFIQSMYEFINKRPRGVGIPHVEPSVFWNTLIPLSPLPEQRRVVAKIEELFTRLDAGVEALKNIKTQLKRYRQSVLKHAFEGKLTAEWRQAHKEEFEPASALLDRIKQERKKTAKSKYKELPPLDNSNLPELPEGWVWTVVEDVSILVTKGSTPTSYNFDYVPHGINFIKVENLKNGRVDRASLAEFITKDTHAFLKRSQLMKDDILFSIAGTIGKVAIVHSDDLPANINQAIAIIRCPWEFVNPDYIKIVFDSEIARQSIERRPRGVGMNNVSLGDVKNIVFPLPPLPEQHRIVEEVERRFSVADQIKKTVDHSLKQAERLRQSILKHAFEGKLVPQDPNDEPAEKLLERIRQERARQQAERKPAKSSKNKSNTKQMRLV